jgi:hypothetical protein
MRVRMAKLALTVGRYREALLHKFMPGRMDVIGYKWPLVPELCPCDLDFCDFLQARQLTHRTVFHFGTGSHHIVGLRNQGDRLENDVLGITAAPGEHATYMQGVIRDARLAERYKVLFGDIYTLTPAVLPRLDVVSLFHLCEFTPPEGARRLTDRALLDMFTEKLSPGGLMLFYRSSFAFARVHPLLDAVVADGGLVFQEEFRSLLVYRAATAEPVARRASQRRAILGGALALD